MPHRQRVTFVPIHEPLKSRVQTFAAGALIFSLAFGGSIGLILTGYLLCSKLWWLISLYLIWIYLVDSKISEKGGRRIEWVRKLRWWDYVRNYLSLKLERLPWSELDAKKNYLFCCFPHGILSTGAFVAFGTDEGGFPNYYPNHKPHLCTLAINFFVPFVRELVLGLGGVSASAKSLNYILSKPAGGNVAVLIVGGAEEAYHCKPGVYKLVLKNRKGFVKIALKNGSPLVPVFSFGETDLYDQPDKKEGSFISKFQAFVKKTSGIAPILPLGRGLFQYNYGLIPQSRPVSVVAGKPIDVEKIENPTQEQIDNVHKTFINQLVELFETQKHLYLADSENLHVEII